MASLASLSASPPASVWRLCSPYKLALLTKRNHSLAKILFISLVLFFVFGLIFFCMDVTVFDADHHAAILLDRLYHSDLYEINNYGSNDNLLVRKDKRLDVPESELKTILYWNDAYGNRNYDIGPGREPFIANKCPETRCLATANRSHLPSVADFDAILIHQRGIQWKDMPSQRSPKQRWVHWNMESAQYIYMDISKLNHLFNWTMTYKKNSDFYAPYGRVHQVRPHPPPGPELDRLISEFGEKNRHLAAGANRTELRAAWFVSHCTTLSRREKYTKMLKRYMPVHVYGKCGNYTCSRADEADCYRKMESEYKFYLSFENSLCDDYVTEKYFNILRYNVIPLTFSGTNMSAISPPHSSIDVMDFKSVKNLVKHLALLQSNDTAFASYFWWRDYYEVRNRPEDRAQAYCELCQALHDSSRPPKVYENMFEWWVKGSQCKKLKLSA